uniref:G-protein coupled receptors family 1 profile domain-containing protein n=1 Tax=Panagrolaimus davidi TaxID=227884 RepID=A0A914PBW1_9BILA
MNDTTAAELSTSEGLECGGKNEAYDFARFALVTYVGTPIALLGLLFNAFLVKVFSNRKRLQTPTFYLFLLAIFDSLICLIYIPFFTIDAFAIYYKNEKLHHIWHSYAMILYGTSRVVQFASTYMVVCATIERFIVVGNIKWLSFVSTEIGRYCTATVYLLVIFVLRLPAFFDYKVIFLPGCPSFEDYTFDPVLMSSEDYAMFNFYVISVVHIIVPFLLLLSLNLLIIALTKKRLYHHFGIAKNFSEMPQISSLLRKESIVSNRKHRSELRYATRTMVTIVFTYLFCNCFNVFITVMENVFKGNPLMFNEDGSR